MLAVYEKSIANPPEDLSLPLEGMPCLKTGKDIAESFKSRRPTSTVYHLGTNGNFMALSHEEETLAHPRSTVVMDDIFCIFNGTLDNTCHLRRYYGLWRQATEAVIIVEAYKVLRDRAPYPPDQVIKELEGKFAFILFDCQAFLGQGDGFFICSDNAKIIAEACGNCCAPFPPGCLFMNGNRLISFDNPLYKVRAIVREDDEGKIGAIIFQVDLYTRLPSIPRSGSASNWSGVTAVEGD